MPMLHSIKCLSLILLLLFALPGAGAVARPRRTGAGIGNCSGWNAGSIGEFRYIRDPLVTHSQYR